MHAWLIAGGPGALNVANGCLWEPASCQSEPTILEGSTNKNKNNFKAQPLGIEGMFLHKEIQWAVFYIYIFIYHSVSFYFSCWAQIPFHCCIPVIFSGSRPGAYSAPPWEWVHNIGDWAGPSCHGSWGGGLRGSEGGWKIRLVQSELNMTLPRWKQRGVKLVALVFGMFFFFPEMAVQRLSTFPGYSGGMMSVLGNAVSYRQHCCSWILQQCKCQHFITLV